MAVAGLSAVVTAFVAALPSLSFAYRNHELHIALQTAEALIALLVSYLVFGRFRRRRRLPELLLCLALVVLAISNLGFSVMPEIFGTDDSVDSTWASLIARLVGGVLFAAAALASDRDVRVGPREERWLAAGVIAGFLVVWAAVEVFEDRLPLGVEPVRGDHGVRLDGHWTILAAQVVGFALYAAAAVGFTRRFERTGDRLMTWLAVGAVLSAAARLNYFLYPSLFSDYVYSGDVFRLAFYLVILAAATQEIRSFWHQAAARAASEERGRVARDLHDGIAQELASIQRNLRWLDADNEFVKRAGASAERALVQARSALKALADSSPARTRDALAEGLRAVADREGAKVVFEAHVDPELASAHRDALVLIASEAVTNAVRHGGVSIVQVDLRGIRPLCLRIRDAGVGFDPDRADINGGMGINVMRARAYDIGAELRVDSRPGAGTSVEVRL